MSLLLLLVNLLLLAGLVYALKKQSWSRQLGPWFFPALSLKLVAGVLLGLLYEYYYHSGDTFTYFNASQQLTHYFHQNPSGYARLLLLNEFESTEFQASLPFTKHAFFSNSFFLVKLISLLNLLTGSSYYLTSLYFSLFSFWGTARLAAALATISPKSRHAAIVAFLFFPSVVFWSSGLLKDSLLMGSMCWVTAFALARAHRQAIRLPELLLALPMLYLFVRIKLYIAIILLPVLLAYFLLKQLPLRSGSWNRPMGQAMLLIAMVGVAGLAGYHLLDYFLPDFLFKQIVHSHDVLLAQSQQRPHIRYEELAPTLQSLASNAPEALVSAVYRPFITESGQPLYLFMGLENLVLLLLTVLLLAWVFRNRKIELQPLHVAFLLYMVVAAVFIGLSTPNFGSLSRYRIAFLPFLVYLLLQHFLVKQLLRQLLGSIRKRRF